MRTFALADRTDSAGRSRTRWPLAASKLRLRVRSRPDSTATSGTENDKYSKLPNAKASDD